MSEWRVLFAGLAALNVGMGCVDLMLHVWTWPVSFAAATFIAFIGAKEREFRPPPREGGEGMSDYKDPHGSEKPGCPDHWRDVGWHFAELTEYNRVVDHIDELHAEIERLRGGLACRYCGSLEWTISIYGRVLHKKACPYNQSTPESSTERRER